MTVLSHRIRLDLNNVQRTWFERCAGTARFVWNWGLNRWNHQYQTGLNPSWIALNRELNAVKATEFPWMTDLPWKVANTALSNLGSAFQSFFRRIKSGSRKPGRPKFKKKGRARDAFSIEGRSLQFDGKRVRIPKLGWVRMREYIRFPGRVLSVRFFKSAQHWMASFQVEIDETRWSYPHVCENQATCGVDLGVKDLAVLSDGTRIEAPRALRQYATELRRLNKELSRRTKGGKNQQKTEAKLAWLHEHISNVRQAVTHEMTADLVRRFRFIGIEDLNVAGMAQGLRLAKSVMDASMAGVRRQMEYKAGLSGSTVVIANRFFPSSKTCCECGHVLARLELGQRRWSCPQCQTEHDRDHNAAKNLERLAAAYAVTAQRQGSSGDAHAGVVKLPSGWEPGNQGYVGVNSHALGSSPG